MSEAGCLPKDLGLIDLDPSEMMFWMYLPISPAQNHEHRLPDNLRTFDPIVRAVRDDCPSAFFLRYVYLTVKTLWVEGSYIGNRPGWHIDGYGTNDVNYIWADRAPTEFMNVFPMFDLSDDCDLSMAQMAVMGETMFDHLFGPFRFPDKHLLRLDNKVIHRSPVAFEPGMRTFVKVSLSHDRYNLKGNSVNHQIPSTHWPLIERGTTRNHPAKES
jgi:hypothetical protein